MAPYVHELFSREGFICESPFDQKPPLFKLLGKILGGCYRRYTPPQRLPEFFPVEILYTPNMFTDGMVRISPIPRFTAIFSERHLTETPYGPAISPAILYSLRSALDRVLDPIFGKNPKVVADMTMLQKYVSLLEPQTPDKDVVFKIGPFYRHTV